MNSKDSTWNEEQVAQLKRLSFDGWSASDIASVIGKTRNAIIGKTHRLGLSLRALQAAVQGEQITREKKIIICGNWVREREPLPAAPRTNDFNYRRSVAVSNSEPKRKLALPIDGGLFQLGGGCRWPVGNDWAADNFFCDDEREHSYPYCSKHCLVAYLNFGRSQVAPRPSAA